MFEVIVRSKTRLKLLVKFFLFDEIQGYIRGMEKELNESANAIRVELNRFVNAGLLTSKYKGRIRFYTANPGHPLFYDLKSIMRKTVGIDQIIYIIINQTDNLQAAYVIGSFAKGIDSRTIELVLVGNTLDKSQIDKLVERTEKMINRKIICFTFTYEQMKYLFKDKPTLMIWEKEE